MINQGQTARELPKYQCFKEVWALKIAKIEGSTITPAEPGYAAFTVEPEYMQKHKPVVGGYFVMYKDGYQSWSPARAFEEGYKAV